ncbi:MAG: peptidoglycan editing factor PgeF [Bacillota bacterium]|jgi:YfiH family protein
MAAFCYHIVNNRPYFHCVTWEAEGISVGCTAESAGKSYYPYRYSPKHSKSYVNYNRVKLAELLRLEKFEWSFMEQIHGTSITEALDNNKDQLQNCYIGSDGLYTREPGKVLTGFFADCVPLYFHAPDSGIIGIVHAGWRGTFNLIAVKMVDKCKRLGASPDLMRVIIGPAIGPCCFTVKPSFLTQLEHLFSQQELAQVVNTDINLSINLKLANQLLLCRAGVLKENITVSGLCTACSLGRLASYRRDGLSAGRFIGWICRRK